MARVGSNDWIEYDERMDRVTAYVFDHLCAISRRFGACWTGMGPP